MRKVLPLLFALICIVVALFLLTNKQHAATTPNAIEINPVKSVAVVPVKKTKKSALCPCEIDGSCKCSVCYCTGDAKCDCDKGKVCYKERILLKSTLVTPIPSKSTLDWNFEKYCEPKENKPPQSTVCLSFAEADKKENQETTYQSDQDKALASGLICVVWHGMEPCLDKAPTGTMFSVIKKDRVLINAGAVPPCVLVSRPRNSNGVKWMNWDKTLNNPNCGEVVAAIHEAKGMNAPKATSQESSQDSGVCPTCPQSSPRGFGIFRR